MTRTRLLLLAIPPTLGVAALFWLWLMNQEWAPLPRETNDVRYATSIALDLVETLEQDLHPQCGPIGISGQTERLYKGMEDGKTYLSFELCGEKTRLSWSIDEQSAPSVRRPCGRYWAARCVVFVVDGPDSTLDALLAGMIRTIERVCGEPDWHGRGLCQHDVKQTVVFASRATGQIKSHSWKRART